jgi:hypothetical protein
VTKHDLWAGVLAVAFLLTVIFLPVQAQPTPTCYQTRTGVVCYPAGQAPAGGSGITPVKRFKPGG